MIGLEELGVSHTQVGALDPLRELPRLRKLVLHGAPVSDLTPLADRAAIAQADALDLTETRVRSTAALAGAGALRELRMINAPVGDLSGLRTLRTLRELRLDGTEVEDLAALAS
jgi:Leucine-rich repeat (LRR) protein